MWNGTGGNRWTRSALELPLVLYRDLSGQIARNGVADDLGRHDGNNAAERRVLESPSALGLEIAVRRGDRGKIGRNLPEVPQAGRPARRREASSPGGRPPSRGRAREPCRLAAGEMDRVRVVPVPIARGGRNDRDDRDRCFAPQRAGADRFRGTARHGRARLRSAAGVAGRASRSAGHVRGVAGVRIGRSDRRGWYRTQHLGRSQVRDSGRRRAIGAEAPPPGSASPCDRPRVPEMKPPAAWLRS